jgi:glycosyltransferase involved in cell wall biosynthesis
MKICIVGRGGPNTSQGLFENDQAMALKKCGCTVVMLVMDARSIRRPRRFGLWCSESGAYPIVYVSLPLGNIPKQIFFAAAIRGFQKAYHKIIEKYGKFDIIHAHFTECGYIVTKGLETEEAPPKIVITEHSSLENRPLEQINPSEIPYARYSYTHADKLVSVSSALAERIFENYHVASEVIPNVVDTSLFTPEKNRRRTSNNMATEFISVGNLIPIKRMELLIRCFHNAFPEGNCHLTILGDGPLRKELEKLIHDLQTDAIALKGHVSREKVADLLKKADVFILLSESETFGVSYIEAMACGLPVIATKCGGPEDFVNEKNGILVNGSEEEIISALRWMHKSANFSYNREDISQFAKSAFSQMSVGNRLIKLYKDMLATNF